ncbi:MAG: hypothetical protein ACK534_07795 [Phenylobacterium sp.]|uniref:hypothetical protein n=1 Tax=Phenylobacterium sp. TaxID=1871053 RepID=UPI00391F4861
MREDIEAYSRDFSSFVKSISSNEIDNSPKIAKMIDSGKHIVEKIENLIELIGETDNQKESHILSLVSENSFLKKSIENLEMKCTDLSSEIARINHLRAAESESLKREIQSLRTLFQSERQKKEALMSINKNKLMETARKRGLLAQKMKSDSDPINNNPKKRNSIKSRRAKF